MAGLQDPSQYLHIGIEWYLNGRFAAINNQKNAPNLTHRGFEYLIKYSLITPGTPRSGMGQEGTRLADYRHDLDSLWKAYKNRYASPSLSQHDTTVQKLHAWEQIRYPGFPHSRPVNLTVRIYCGPGLKRSNDMDYYDFVLEEADHLFQAIFATTQINPAFLRSWLDMGVSLHEWYEKVNRHLVEM